MRMMILFCMIVSAANAWAQDTTAPLSPRPLFALREMDMHLHAGFERELPLEEWIDLAVADGRKAFLLLDHIELYRQSPAEYAEWVKEDKLTAWYAVGMEGHRRRDADFMQLAAKRKELLIFRGIEVAEFELDEGLEKEPMEMAEVIGWHISPNHDGPAPDGRLLIKRIQQIKRVQKKFSMPMILFHPFSARLEHLVTAAKAAGKTPDTLSVDACRFFTPEQQQEVIRLLKDTSIYVEMPHGVERYWGNPIFREALIADIKPLADAGVKFTVSTDNHSVAAAKNSFQPEAYCAPCGITPENANALIEELVARRARSGH